MGRIVEAYDEQLMAVVAAAFDACGLALPTDFRDRHRLQRALDKAARDHVLPRPGDYWGYEDAGCLDDLDAMEGD